MNSYILHNSVQLGSRVQHTILSDELNLTVLTGSILFVRLCLINYRKYYKMNRLKLCSYSFGYTSVLLLLTGLFSCSTPYTPTQPLISDETNVKVFNAKLQTSSGWYRDTIIIKGKNFGDHATSLAVYLDEIHVKAVVVKDSIVKFTIPEGIEKKTYHVRLQVLNEITDVEGELGISSPKWYDFTSVGVDAFLYGRVHTFVPEEYKEQSVKVMTGVAVCKQGSVFSSTIDGGIVTIQDGCGYRPCGKGDINPKYESYHCSSGKGVKIKLDTINKMVISLKVSIVFIERYQSAFSSSYAKEEEKRFEIENAPYKHVENGIEVYLESKDIQQKLKYAKLHQYDSYNLSYYYSFISSLETFKEDNYIKIFLKSEK